MTTATVKTIPSRKYVLLQESESRNYRLDRSVCVSVSELSSAECLN